KIHLYFRPVFSKIQGFLKILQIFNVIFSKQYFERYSRILSLQFIADFLTRRAIKIHPEHIF
ncbi:MAG: hypothetical protein J6S91_01755, partial [Treponema sp.]|nr:hypothetical protein [Treponema sp.]